jgi:hypothetical protein
MIPMTSLNLIHQTIREEFRMVVGLRTRSIRYLETTSPGSGIYFGPMTFPSIFGTRCLEKLTVRRDQRFPDSFNSILSLFRDSEES